MTFENLQLKQRGRAEINFMLSTFAGSSAVRASTEVAIQSAISDVASSVDDLPDCLDERNSVLEESLYKNRTFRVQQLMGEWYSRNHGPAAVRAFEEIQEELQAQLDRLRNGATTLESNDDFNAPVYWENVDFHRTKGGWDGHPYMGFVHGEIVHRKMVDSLFPGGIFKQRLQVAGLGKQDHYDQILDMGCSTGHFTKALAETYPDAKITGIDLSLKTLEHAQRVGNAHGYSWRLLQRAAEDTQFEQNSFDLVVSYILLHEIPSSAVKAVFAEALRVLKPGGEMLMSDVSRYADMTKLDQWRADRGAMYGGEPHWRESASLDLGQIAKDVGFTVVSAGGVDDEKYPYVVQAIKSSEVIGA